jgi:predicted outer membrane repeat protein
VSINLSFVTCIWNEGTLLIKHSTLSDNSAATDGGAIFTDGGLLTIDHSTLSGNHADGAGGAIFCQGDSVVTITYSTLSGNSVGDATSPSLGGGAICNACDPLGSVTIDNCTLSKNYAVGGIGGAILNGGMLTVENSSVFGNFADIAGGGIYNDNGSEVGFGTLYVTNGSTVTGNRAPAGADLYNLGTAQISGHSTVGVIGP